MSWKKVKLGDFLTNRENRFKPNDKAIIALKRIEKIDFSGEIFLSDKPSNTDMILIKKGDLVISGINVEKGAMAVYTGDEDITATIHYSSYNFNENKIDIEFLKHFLKSSEFKEALKEQVPGGIKTEIKPKHLLPLIVEIPTDINDQKKVVSKLKKQNSKIENIDTELTHQLDLVKQLRQAFLREAMQGRLVSQNPADGSADDLLRQIKAEKQKLIANKKLKKEKELPPIKPEEIPFDIPDNWVWCRLERICLSITDGDHQAPPKSNAGIPFIVISNIKNNNLVFDKTRFVPESYYANLPNEKKPIDGDLLYTVTGSFGIPVLLKNAPFFCVQRHIAIIKPIPYIANKWLFYLLKSQFLYRQAFEIAWGIAQRTIPLQGMRNFLIPLPPLSEQGRIVEKLDELMGLCDELEQSIRQSREQSDMLLRQVLREALQGEVVVPVERVPVRIEPTVSHETIKVIDFKPTNVDYYKRTLLAAEIVYQLQKEPTLGHLKLQKLIYLCQKSEKMALPTNFLQQAMGPYDPTMMRSIDHQLKEKKWFKYDISSLLKYQPLEKAGEHHKDFEKYFSTKTSSIQWILDTFKTAKSDRVEIIATLFACWDNILTNKEVFSDNLLIKHFYEWSKEKEKFDEQNVRKELIWMKNNDLFPKG